MLKHYRSLMPMAIEARKPIFHLKSADGALGAHIYAVQSCPCQASANGRFVGVPKHLENETSGPRFIVLLGEDTTLKC